MRLLAILLVAPMLPFSGCTDDDDTDRPDGHYVHFFWGNSQSTCNNNDCTYGQNHETFEIELKCRVQPTLSWDAKNWIHGRVVADVLDDAEAKVATHTVSSNGKGSKEVPGQAGTWTLTGHTDDANGNMDVRLACGP